MSNDKEMASLYVEPELDMHVVSDKQVNKDSFLSKLTRLVVSNIKNKNVLAIDIGMDSIKIIELRKDENTIRITNTFIIEDANKYFKDGVLINKFGLTENIAEIIYSNQLKIHEIVLVGHFGKVQTKLLPLPMFDKKDIEIFINSEIEKYFPNYSKQKDVLDYMLFGKVESEDSKNIMGIISIVPEDEATKIVEEFKKLKMTVNALDVEIHAISNILRLSEEDDTDRKDGMIFKIGNKESQVFFANKGILIFERKISFGVKDIIRAVQDSLEISTREAEVIVRDYGAFSTEDIMVRNESYNKDLYNQIIEKIYSEVLSEVIRSYQYVVSNYELEFNEIMIINGGGNLKNIADLTTQILDIQTKSWSLESNEVKIIDEDMRLVNKTGKRIDSSYSTVIGAALRGVSHV